jgi:WD40 repeat protein
MPEVPILAASPDGRHKVSYRWSESGRRRVLDSETICLFEEGRDPRLLQPLSDWTVKCAALSNDGVLAVGLEPFPELYPYVERLDETIAILDIHRDSEFSFLTREIEQRNAPSVRVMVFSDDGALLVAGGSHGVAVWDMASRAVVRAIAVPRDRPKHVYALAVSPDNGTIAFATQPGELSLCPTFGARKPFELVAGGSAVQTIKFLDSEAVAVTFADGSARSWNVLSAREL